MDKEENYTDFSNVEKQRNFLTAEDYPEGPYGAPRGSDTPVENKSTPWEDGQQFYTNSTYEFRNLHQDLPRQFPQAHETNDKKNKNEEQPYTKPKES
ncbi:cytosolic protein [Metabacillus fastidiosus]|uniref:cytosolic protein n=1 Tax=Metabacillus fastidiosus TaxID=1458 RepID=UPI003D2B9FE0